MEFVLINTELVTLEVSPAAAEDLRFELLVLDEEGGELQLLPLRLLELPAATVAAAAVLYIVDRLLTALDIIELGFGQYVGGGGRHKLC
jgi:hypothetical protein